MIERTIGFASELVPNIRDGSKTLTFRTGVSYGSLTVGEKIKARDSGKNEIFGDLEILAVCFQRFADLPIEMEGHESYQSKNEQREVLGRYSRRSIDDDANITIIKFKFIKHDL